MIRTESGLLRQWRSASIVLTTGTIALIAVATLIFPTNAYAHDGDSNPNVIHACVQQGSKQVRIVGVNGSCTNAETAAHWAVVGPSGATGAQGPQGPQGSTGAEGPAGANGAPGAQGPDGAQGPEGPEGPAGTPAVLGVAMTSGLPDIRLNGTNVVNTWYVVTGRTLQINKSSATSKLRITYQDSLGARANIHNACQWRIVIDRTVLSFFSDGDYEGPYGWRIHNGAHNAWATDIAAGPHEVRVEFLRTPSASDCLSGWNTVGNFLSVEEIP